MHAGLAINKLNVLLKRQEHLGSFLSLSIKIYPLVHDVFPFGMLLYFWNPACIFKPLENVYDTG